MNRSTLASGFLQSSERFTERPALEVNNEVWSYGRLYERAAALAATMQLQQAKTDPKLTAVLAHRSSSAFVGILGALLRGHGYVPLNPNFPSERIVTVLDRSGCESLIVGSEAIQGLPDILRDAHRDLCVYLPDRDDVALFEKEYPRHVFVPSKQFRRSADWQCEDPDDEATAYLLFTSGSTGVPKGVDISHKSIRYFIDFVVERYEVTEEDRFSQMFELVFDLSLFDMFVAWECGACLCCPSKGDAQMPARYINDSGITIWFSVPSLGVAMSKMRMLKPDIYPQLRLSLFCGEALRSDIAEQWTKAAPNSVVENLYGPTEVTLACTYYRWESEAGMAESNHGNVPIGYPFRGMDAIIVEDDLREVAAGEEGELLMSGPQVARGYWNDTEKTEAAFLVPPDKTERYYRTGDLVRQASAKSPIEYVGRIDHQVKIRGNRIELGEIEAVIRGVPGVNQAIAVGWPRSASGIDGITVFLQAANIDFDVVKKQAESSLPSYMAPREYIPVDDMPLNQNGKIDRKALLLALEEK